MTVRKEPNRPTYLWHHDIHTRIGNEQLVFVLVGFDPVYRRQRVLQETRRVLSDLEIKSYALWELVGDHDLMIQAWLPRGVRANEFVSTLGDAVSVEIDTLTMAVDSFISHWMGKANNLTHAQTELDPSDYGNLNEGWVPRTRISKYREAGLIHAVRKARAPEIFIRITNPRRGKSPTIEAQIQELAEELLNENIAMNRVIMKVSGDATYLITGRLPLRNFEAVAEVLQGSLAKSGVLETLRCRTVTTLSGLYAPLEIVEQLRPIATGDATQKPSEQDLDRWLKENESDTLEFKSSAFTDLDYEVGRKEKARPKVEQVREIAKALVGMLNADGGTLVIGVTELNRFQREDLLRVCPEGVEAGQQFVMGIDFELPKGGWDAYQRTLAANLRKSIEGAIDGWLSYYEVKFRSRTVCAIRIRRPSAWFYVKETSKEGVTRTEFYGRTGGETRPLSGQKMDQFKDAHPRTTRSD